MKIKNIFLALKDQLPIARLMKNIISGDIRGLLHMRSHLTASGSPKVKYNTKSSALKAADSMSKKHMARFASYKCIHCDGYHIGKSQLNS